MYQGDSYTKIWEVGGKGTAFLLCDPPVCSPLGSGRKLACLSLEERESVNTGKCLPEGLGLLDQGFPWPQEDSHEHQVCA